MRSSAGRAALLLGVLVLGGVLASPRFGWSQFALNGLPTEVQWLAGYADRNAAQTGVLSNVALGVNLRPSGLFVATNVAALHTGGVRLAFKDQAFESKAIVAFPSAQIAAVAFDSEAGLPVPRSREPVMSEKVTIVSATSRQEPILTRGLVTQVSPVDKGGVFYVDIAKAGRVRDGVVMSGDRVLGIVTHEGLRVRCLSLAAIEQLVSRWQEKPAEAPPASP